MNAPESNMGDIKARIVKQFDISHPTKTWLKNER